MARSSMDRPHPSPPSPPSPPAPASPAPRRGSPRGRCSRLTHEMVIRVLARQILPTLIQSPPCPHPSACQSSLPAPQPNRCLDPFLRPRIIGNAIQPIDLRRRAKRLLADFVILA